MTLSEFVILSRRDLRCRDSCGADVPPLWRGAEVRVMAGATLRPCECGRVPALVAGHYPDWREIHCGCGRIEFGHDEAELVARWNDGHK